MYVPSHFEERHPEALHRVIRAHPLGALVLSGTGGLDANHLPFELDTENAAAPRLLAHVARANPLWQEAVDGNEALVIFRGAEAYISPNWYPSKHETHRQVPTWNYQAVHVHGRIAIHDDERFVREVVARLTHTHELRAGYARPWRMSDSPRDFIERMIAAVVGLEIRIERIVGKSKLSQNRDQRDRRAAADALQARGEDHMATAMLETLDTAT